jgi:hypothetical protein
MSEVAPTYPKPFHAESFPLTEESRRFARKPCKLAAKLTFSKVLLPGFDSAQPFEVIVRNISRGGLCFLFFAQLYPDDQLTLDFGDLVRDYRVARCRKIGEHCFEIGVAVIGQG